MKTKRILYLLLSVIISCQYLCSQNYSERDYISITRDWFAYETIPEMYEIAETKEYANNIRPVINTISILFDEIYTKYYHFSDHKEAREKILWEKLQQLEPYRMEHEVQEYVDKWTNMAANMIRGDAGKEAGSKEEIAGICQMYQQGEFNKVIELSRKCLLKSELNSLIRNNLALALMHNNLDLCAQIQLLIIDKSRNDGKYIPASINLTVLYERMGKSDEARKTALELLEYTQKEGLEIPLVNYNAAWYWKPDEIKSFEMRNFPLKKSMEVGKYKELISLLWKKYKSQSLIKIGLAGKWKMTSSIGKIILGIILFLLVEFITMTIVGVYSGGLYKRSSQFFTLLFAFIGFIVLFLLFWGYPESVLGWIMIILNCWIFYSLTRMVTGL